MHLEMSFSKELSEEFCMAEETLEIVNAILADDPDFFLGSDVEKPVKKSRTREHSIDYDSNTWM